MEQLKLFEPKELLHLSACRDCSLYTEGWTQDGRTYKCRYEAICMILAKEAKDEANTVV